jgi:hypothetical protein
MSMTDVKRYQARMTERGDFWPAGDDAEGIAMTLELTERPGAAVLRWECNGRFPQDDMLAAWLVLGVISEQQAEATSEAHDADTKKLLAEYRANPPQPSPEQLAEMRAAFGPGETVVNVITGEEYRF